MSARHMGQGLATMHLLPFLVWLQEATLVRGEKLQLSGSQFAWYILPGLKTQLEGAPGGTNIYFFGGGSIDNL